MLQNRGPRVATSAVSPSPSTVQCSNNDDAFYYKVMLWIAQKEWRGRFVLLLLVLPSKMGDCVIVTMNMVPPRHDMQAALFYLVLLVLLLIDASPLLNRSLIISLEHYYVSTYERARNGIINQPLLLMSLLLDYNAPRSFAHPLSALHTYTKWMGWTTNPVSYD